MYIIQNALKNVARNKGRNVLIAAIIFAVIATTVVALMINNTASGVIDDYKSRFGAQVNISVDIDKFIESGLFQPGAGGMAIPQVSAQESIRFADSDYLRDYIMQVSISVTSDDLAGIDEGASGGIMLPDGSSHSFGKFMLRSSFTDFESGLRSIMDGGRMAENDNECVISREFAILNSLSVNDNITLYATMTNENDGTERTAEYNLTVAGIYYDFTDEYPGMRTSVENKRNEILTTTGTLLASMNTDERGLSVAATYFLKNPSMLEGFEAETRAKGLSDYMSVSADEDGYNRIIAPVEGLKGISVTFMIIVLVLGSLVIILLSSIAVRERKYEIGVLRAMGMKKGKVALGLWSEMLIITGICLCLGLAAGMVISQPVCDMLLAGQVEAAQASQNTSGMPMPLNSPGSASVNLPALEQIDISVGLMTIAQIIGISLLIASAAGIASISKITKYEPIKILMERN